MRKSDEIRKEIERFGSSQDTRLNQEILLDIRDTLIQIKVNSEKK